MSPTQDDSDDPPRVSDGAGGVTGRPRAAPPASDFGWQGWVLVGVLVVSLLVVPTTILFLPEAQGFIRSLGLTLRDAYLTLPLIPAFALGATAVWAAVRLRSD